jgi:hypothetical protein
LEKIMEQGLAQEAARQGAGVAEEMPTVEEIAMLLSQGVPPEELMAAGIPQSLIEDAITLLRQAEQQQAAPTGAQSGNPAAGRDRGMDKGNEGMVRG